MAVRTIGMSRRQRLIMTCLWAAMVASVVALLAAWAGAKFPSPNSEALAAEPLESLGYPVPEFSLTNQAGKIVSADQLAGKPWIAAFIFTRCPGPCPITTARMKQLQPQLPAEIHMISFSLDPDYDTPPILTEYAAKFAADTSHWDFLTGHKATILKIAGAMQIGTQMGATEQDIIHSTYLVLVGADNKVVQYYQPSDTDRLRQLAIDARQLLAKPTTPQPASAQLSPTQPQTHTAP